jgi:NAD+--dinitrogen-reductase ADP-D-ribosyltransferase
MVLSEHAVPDVAPYLFGSNLANVPAWVLTSVGFNDRPSQLHLSGVRERAPGLFRLLQAAEDPAAAGVAFARYMGRVFGPRAEEATSSMRRRHRASHLELLSGWGMDSNSRAGAVLKGWVESRFGFAPTFHRQPLGRFPSAEWLHYVEEKGAARYRNNDIDRQLDLLFEYAQWFVARFGHPGRTFVRMWRGVNGFAEDSLVEGSLRDRHCVLRLNNLVSFSLSRERAEEFGDWILEVEVPTTKLLFFQGLLPGSPLAAEGEALVIGGDYHACASYL